MTLLLFPNGPEDPKGRLPEEEEEEEEEGYLCYPSRFETE